MHISVTLWKLLKELEKLGLNRFFRRIPLNFFLPPKGKRGK